MSATTSTRPGLPTRIWRSPLRPEVLVLLGVAAFVQVVFPYRQDWPAHLAAGGGALLIVAALTPRAAGRLAGLLGFVAVLAMGWVSEHLLFGPPDVVDVSFTLAGAVVTYQAGDAIGRTGGPIRAQAIAWGTALIVGGLLYRYGTSIGPT